VPNYGFGNYNQPNQNQFGFNNGQRPKCILESRKREAVWKQVDAEVEEVVAIEQ